MSTSGAINKIRPTYWVIAIVIVLTALILWLANIKHATKEEFKSQNTTNPQTNTTGASPTAGLDQEAWTGVLRISNNSAKGNFMLITKTRNVYIRTGRDYSSLVGKEVSVSYEGNYDNFVLGDITLNPPQ